MLQFVNLFLACLQTVFQVQPLSAPQWMAVIKISMPVIFLDEILKFFARNFTDGETRPLRLFVDFFPVLVMWLLYFLYIAIDGI